MTRTDLWWALLGFVLFAFIPGCQRGDERAAEPVSIGHCAKLDGMYRIIKKKISGTCSNSLLERDKIVRLPAQSDDSTDDVD